MKASRVVKQWGQSEAMEEAILPLLYLKVSKEMA